MYIVDILLQLITLQLVYSFNYFFI